jgi:hypothetical protein
MEQRKAELEKEIVILEAKADKARRQGDHGRVRFFQESISSLKRTLRLLPQIYGIKGR